MSHKIMASIVGLLLTVACTQTGRLQRSVEDFKSTDWVLVEIDGGAAVDRVQATIRFQGNNRIAGWGGCNRYFANIRSGRNYFKVGPIGSTRRICPPVVMEQEERFFDALQKSTGIRMENDQLVIDSEATREPLKFGRLKKPGS